MLSPWWNCFIVYKCETHLIHQLSWRFGRSLFKVLLWSFVSHHRIIVCSRVGLTRKPIFHLRDLPQFPEHCNFLLILFIKWFPNNLTHTLNQYDYSSKFCNIKWSWRFSTQNTKGVPSLTCTKYSWSRNIPGTFVKEMDCVFSSFVFWITIKLYLLHSWNTFPVLPGFFRILSKCSSSIRLLGFLFIILDQTLFSSYNLWLLMHYSV